MRQCLTIFLSHYFVNLTYDWRNNGGYKMVKDNKTRYTLRIDDNLLEKVHVICKKEQRSLNQQLIFMLQNLVDDYEKQYGTIETTQD